MSVCLLGDDLSGLLYWEAAPDLNWFQLQAKKYYNLKLVSVLCPQSLRGRNIQALLHMLHLNLHKHVFCTMRCTVLADESITCHTKNIKKGSIFLFLNQSEQTGLWFQTEGEKRCCSEGSMRKIKSFLNNKAWRHVPVETLNMNRNMSRIGPL